MLVGNGMFVESKKNDRNLSFKSKEEMSDCDNTSLMCCDTPLIL